jgi:hypothetical protein
MDGLSLTGVKARIDASEAAQGSLGLAVDQATLRLGPKAITALLPPGDKISLDHLEEGRGFLRTSLIPLGGAFEVSASVLPGGRGVSFRVVAFKAAGFLPVPLGVVMGALRTFLPPTPGVSVGQESLDLDLTALLNFATAGQAVALQLGPLRSASITPGYLELEI